MGRWLRPTAVLAACEGGISLPDGPGIRRVKLTLGGFEDAGLERLYRHWNRARHEHPWLPWTDFRPEECGAVLARVALIDAPQPGMPGHRIRLTGEAIANARLGFAKGRMVEEIVPPWYRDHLLSCYEEVFVHGRAVRQLAVASFGLSVTAYERLILPASRSGTKVDLILVATGPPCDPAPILASAGESAPQAEPR